MSKTPNLSRILAPGSGCVDFDVRAENRYHEMPETRNDPKASWEVLDSGRCMWRGDTHIGVHLIRIPYDYWYELGKADGNLEPGAHPELGNDGFGYYIVWGDDPLGWKISGVSSPTMKTPDEAFAWANLEAKSDVTWNQGP